MFFSKILMHEILQILGIKWQVMSGDVGIKI